MSLYLELWHDAPVDEVQDIEALVLLWGWHPQQREDLSPVVALHGRIGGLGKERQVHLELINHLLDLQKAGQWVLISYCMHSVEHNRNCKVLNTV